MKLVLKYNGKAKFGGVEIPTFTFLDAPEEVGQEGIRSRNCFTWVNVKTGDVLRLFGAKWKVAEYVWNPGNAPGESWIKLVMEFCEPTTFPDDVVYGTIRGGYVSLRSTSNVQYSPDIKYPYVENDTLLLPLTFKDRIIACSNGCKYVQEYPLLFKRLREGR
ncbi:hypothetical protein [Pseudothermotoga sp.]|uniref:hypothetical protein n=1 Tax=Pseudothermotoga sp. TaxID=2033661 RepID=UPI0031F64AF3